MSLLQFLHLIWARRVLIAAATVSCVIGAAIVIMIVPPRFEANARVMLNLLKPDPVTGEVITTQASRTYVATQTELIRDYTVAGGAVDRLGWLSDPGLIAQYAGRSKSDNRDFRRWVAQRVMDGTKARVIAGSNILEISYSSNSAETARAVVDAVRQSYIDTTLSLRREEASRNAEWYTSQAEQARRRLEAADTAKTAFERQTGVILQDGTSDVESVRLGALAMQAGAPAAPMVSMAPIASPSSGQLAQIDAQIAEAGRRLGPNHPRMQELRTQRDVIAQAVAREESGARASAAAAARALSAGVGALNSAVEAQKNRVIAQRDKVERLRLLQAEVDLRREQMNKAAARAAELNQEAAALDAGISSLGAAVTPQKPSFPNKPLLVVGSLAVGMATGLLASLLIELLVRRIRSVDDLRTAIDAPLLAVIAPPAGGRRPLSALFKRGKARSAKLASA